MCLFSNICTVFVILWCTHIHMPLLNIFHFCHPVIANAIKLDSRSLTLCVGFTSLFSSYTQHDLTLFMLYENKRCGHSCWLKCPYKDPEVKELLFAREWFTGFVLGYWRNRVNTESSTSCPHTAAVNPESGVEQPLAPCLNTHHIWKHLEPSSLYGLKKHSCTRWVELSPTEGSNFCSLPPEVSIQFEMPTSSDVFLFF